MAYVKQNELLLQKLRQYYENDDYFELDRILKILNGESNISLRILDWFVTNYAKQKYIVYELKTGDRFKVYNDYKLKLKAYSKKRFDPFCRWDKIIIPYRNNQSIQTTIEVNERPDNFLATVSVSVNHFFLSRIRWLGRPKP